MKIHVKTKTWIENDSHDLLFGKGKTDLLELIEEEGSIAGAAQRLSMNYKKAWTHIKTLRKHFADELVLSRKGGSGAGGTTLTPTARSLIKNYRTLQDDIESYANHRFRELFDPDSQKPL